jgi:hypothetical protein
LASGNNLVTFMVYNANPYQFFITAHIANPIIYHPIYTGLTFTEETNEEAKK